MNSPSFSVIFFLLAIISSGIDYTNARGTASAASAASAAGSGSSSNGTASAVSGSQASTSDSSAVSNSQASTTSNTSSNGPAPSGTRPGSGSGPKNPGSPSHSPAPAPAPTRSQPTGNSGKPVRPYCDVSILGVSLCNRGYLLTETRLGDICPQFVKSLPLDKVSPGAGDSVCNNVIDGTQEYYCDVVRFVCETELPLGR